MSAKVENTEYLAMARRIVRAAGRRLGENPDDLAGLIALSRELDQAVVVAVQAAREQYGMSWAEIGGLLGVTRQAAQQRYGHVA